MARRLIFLSILAAFAISAQQPADAPKPPRRPGGFGAMMPDALAVDNRDLFQPIFDGTSLTGWDGDPGHWRVENGVIVGESTKENPLKRNTFLIWRGGAPGNFELKLDYKINNTNSGVQYRSMELSDQGQWILKGYQADIDFQNTYTGQLYEERGRGFLALRGQATNVAEGKKARVIGNIKDGIDAKGVIKVGDWNTLHIIAQGNLLVHILNGQVTAVVVDDDSKARAESGLLGFQLHVGAPMRAEFRNIALKQR
ncbi:MAG: DUF1080 domain-containing protein [Acidobacteria bacterium]|nr:DUF1080 domain-containing protein [Acidobacteriota bacterium]